MYIYTQGVPEKMKPMFLAIALVFRSSNYEFLSASKLFENVKRRKFNFNNFLSESNIHRWELASFKLQAQFII